MKYEGQELITLPTIRTKRNLLIVSFGVLALKVFAADLSTAEILGVRPPPTMFDAVAFIVTLYLAVMLAWHWYVDYQIWRSTPLYEPLTDGSRQRRTVWGATLGLTGYLEKAANEMEENNAIDQETREKISKLERTFQAVPRRARCLFVGGYLVLPLIMGISALVWLSIDLVGSVGRDIVPFVLGSCCS